MLRWGRRQGEGRARVGGRRAEEAGSLRFDLNYSLLRAGFCYYRWKLEGIGEAKKLQRGTGWRGLSHSPAQPSSLSVRLYLSIVGGSLPRHFAPAAPPSPLRPPTFFPPPHPSPPPPPLAFHSCEEGQTREGKGGKGREGVGKGGVEKGGGVGKGEGEERGRQDGSFARG